MITATTYHQVHRIQVIKQFFHEFEQMLYFTLSITALCGIVLLIQATFLSHKRKTKDTNKSLSG